MAKKQTRRCVSLNRDNYEATKQEADRRGMTIAGLVEFALRSIGVPVVSHPQQSPEMARTAAARRAERATARHAAGGVEGLPSREHQPHGDEAADAHGLQ